MKYDIFISYRRLGSDGRVAGRDIARLLSKELKMYGYNVFFDYSEIKDNDFEKTILPAIRNCDIFILVLTSEALDRCVNEEDWVRREILEAHENGRKIITVNPNYEFKNFPSNLPQRLNFLRTIQMSVIDMDSNFEITVEKMVRYRIQVKIPTERLKIPMNKNTDIIELRLGNNLFEIPDELFNLEVYNALKRSYQ